MGNGKRGTAPCGHPGEAVIGQYFRCLFGCDSPPQVVDWEDVTLEWPRCPGCGSINTEEYQLDPMFYLFNPGSSYIIDTRCVDCGKCWLNKP